MALNPKDLAAQIQAVQNQPAPAPDDLLSYCTGYVNMLKAGVVNHASGTINGVTVPGAPLTLGSAVGGLMVLTPGPWVAESGALGPLAAAEHAAVTTYVLTGTVSFLSGNIIGTCTNTPSSPGPLVAGAGQRGMIIGLVGGACAAAVSSSTGGQLFGPDAITVYTAIMNYTLANAEVNYAPNAVVGVCPPGGGPLTGGSGLGGVIT